MVELKGHTCFRGLGCIKVLINCTCGSRSGCIDAKLINRIEAAIKRVH